MELYVYGLQKLHSQGESIDGVIEIFMTQTKDFFEGIEQVYDNYEMSTSIRKYLIEQKQKTLDAILYIAEDNKFLEYQSDFCKAY